MKFEASDPKKGMTITELRDAVAKLEELVKANILDPSSTAVKVWVNMKAGIKSLEV